MPFPKGYFHRYRGWNFPTPELVYLIHDSILETSPGRAGVAHESVIESAAPSEREAATVMILVAMGLLSIQGLRVALMAWCDIDPADSEA